MSRNCPELENVLKSLLAEHRKLLAHVEAHHAAMKAMDLEAMEAARSRQEAGRMRITALENHRRTLMQQMAAAARQPSLTIGRLAELYPQHGPALLAVRNELRLVVAEVARRSHGAGRLASAVLGHLNTAVRLLAGAMHHGGVYTKQGVPNLTGRVGAIEAVG